jgi:multicomponent Na+:H+ antiporter subunit E
MTFFVVNLIIAFVWAGLIGSFSLGSLFFGYVLGYVILFLFSRGRDANHYLDRIPGFIFFTAYYLIELVRANVQIAIDLLRIRPRFQPGFVKVPLDVESDVAITLLANLVTMTPGTMTVDVSADHKFLLVHGLYITDEAAVVHDIKHNLERRIQLLIGDRNNHV